MVAMLFLVIRGVPVGSAKTEELIFNHHSLFILMMPTGHGKSLINTLLAAKIEEATTGLRIFVVSPNGYLTSRMFIDWGCGISKSDVLDEKRIQFITYD